MERRWREGRVSERKGGKREGETGLVSSSEHEERKDGTYVHTEESHTTSDDGEDVGRIGGRKIEAPSRDSSDGELRDGEVRHGSNGEEHRHEERDRDKREDEEGSRGAVVPLPVGGELLVDGGHRRHVAFVLCLGHGVLVDLGLGSDDDHVGGLSEVSDHHRSDGTSDEEGSHDDRSPPWKEKKRKREKGEER